LFIPCRQNEKKKKEETSNTSTVRESEPSKMDIACSYKRRALRISWRLLTLPSFFCETKWENFRDQVLDSSA
jgi:hypothetical protein